ncbi:hypothetical protein ET495_11545 [Xylanimonas allomyrinae]|uniref:Uncharacterized protein n=1 Tax=Xylanimonas allomyrinae TaxID=2509459 RepID=A0A4P6EQQ5_9MICO|nr:hypothetical protein [Xylanimonas allomyrinae]QAY63769.1 hypothetical protein ET495_11545 [Xylanimonas allomyrinae]
MSGSLSLRRAGFVAPMVGLLVMGAGAATADAAPADATITFTPATQYVRYGDAVSIGGRARG